MRVFSNNALAAAAPRIKLRRLILGPQASRLPGRESGVNRKLQAKRLWSEESASFE
jgi:hypothetical protein